MEWNCEKCGVKKPGSFDAMSNRGMLHYTIRDECPGPGWGLRVAIPKLKCQANENKQKMPVPCGFNHMTTAWKQKWMNGNMGVGERRQQVLSLDSPALRQQSTSQFASKQAQSLDLFRVTHTMQNCIIHCFLLLSKIKRNCADSLNKAGRQAKPRIMAGQICRPEIKFGSCSDSSLREKGKKTTTEHGNQRLAIFRENSLKTDLYEFSIVAYAM